MKGIIFDLDGTLLDSMRMWHTLDRRFLTSLGIEPPADISERLKTMTVEEACCWYAEQFPTGMTPGEIEQRILELASDAYRYELMLKPGAKALLEALRGRQIPFGLASVTYHELLEAALVRLGIRGLFRFILTPKPGEPGKETPALYLKAAALLRAEPAEIVVIEDALYAAKTAKAAGFYTVGVYEPEQRGDWEAMQAVCDRTADSLEELRTPAFLAQFT